VCRPWRSPGDARSATLVRTIARYDRVSKSPDALIAVSYHLVVQKMAVTAIVNNVYQLLVWASPLMLKKHRSLGGNLLQQRFWKATMPLWR